MPERNAGERIKELRALLELSQRDLSEILDVRQATVSAWETGASEPGKGWLRLISDLTKFDKATYRWLTGERSKPRILPADLEDTPGAAKTYGFEDEAQKKHVQDALDQLSYIQGRMETTLRLVGEFREEVEGLDLGLEDLVGHLEREGTVIQHSLELMKGVLEELADGNGHPWAPGAGSPGQEEAG